MTRKISCCVDCRKDKLIRAQKRCSTCYGRYWMSPAFELIAPQNQRRHRLSNVDGTQRLADCNRCGQVRVTAIRDYRGKVGYRCNVARAEQKRRERSRVRSTVRTV